MLTFSIQDNFNRFTRETTTISGENAASRLNKWLDLQYHSLLDINFPSRDKRFSIKGGRRELDPSGGTRTECGADELREEFDTNITTIYTPLANGNLGRLILQL